ncbi:MAG: FHIPEP family type III secretion protein [Leptospirales bacterium]|nr:FHIPEP family type III secretion protein [Leptospirales bacterium]
MKDDRRFLSLIKKISIAVIIIAILIMLVPIPALLLDILIAVNLISAFAILAVSRRAGKVADFPTCPIWLLLSTAFGMAVNISATRLIFTKGKDFDGRLIGFVSDFVAGSGEIAYLAASLVIFIVITIVHAAVIVRRQKRIAETASRFTIDAMRTKQKDVDAGYNAGLINQDMAASMKAALQREYYFYNTMYKVGKFISANEKFRIFVIAATITGGILIGTKLRGESINDAVKLYIPLGIASGFLFMCHALLLALTVGSVITRIWAARTETHS